MIEVLADSYIIEQSNLASEKSSTPAGLSDWKRVVESIGNRSLANFIDVMDPGNPASGINAHRVIAERLQILGIPYQPHVSTKVKDFVEQPQPYFDQLNDGEYFFVSVRPGTHLTHATSQEEVVSFVRNFAAKNSSPKDLEQELYLSHNGEPILSGHIVVRDEHEPNSIYAEFTNADFNSFHRGFRTPEILVRRNQYRFEWEFRGELKPRDDTWRTEERFLCNGNVHLSRPEIAQKIFSTIKLLPHDGNTYLPGYYEVLLERTTGVNTRATFIEAVIAKAVLEGL